jgi:hypothetical protein
MRTPQFDDDDFDWEQDWKDHGDDLISKTSSDGMIAALIWIVFLIAMMAFAIVGN